MSKKIFLSPPHMSGEEMTYINKAFQQNWIAPIGENIDAFEHQLEQLFEGKKVVVLNSGTSALHLGLKLLDVQAGDYVICQNSSFIATLNPILYLGAKPVFVDIETDTYNICPVALEHAVIDLQQKNIYPKAMMLCNSYGMPHKHKEISGISKKYDIPILEDSASALGSTYLNKSCGTLGNIGVISFNGNKIITTSAGGALICNNQEEKDRVIYWATQSKYQQKMIHREVGFNYRMSNVLAGIGLGQLTVLNQRVEQRRRNHEVYIELLKNTPLKLVNEPNKDYYSNYWLNCVLFRCEEELLKALMAFEEENIEVRRVWKPLNEQPLGKMYWCYGVDNANTFYQKGLCLPSGSNLNNEDFDRIKKVIERLSYSK